MRYKTFRALVVGGFGALVLGAGAEGVHVLHERANRPPPPAPAPVAFHPAAETLDGGQGRPALPPPTQLADAANPATNPGTTTNTAPANLPPGGIALRPMDRMILDRIQGAGGAIPGSKVKDAFSSQAWKVNLYKDAGQSKVNRLKIDLNRNNKWDEKWTITGDEVKRQVAPADDENYTLEYRLRAGAWVPKK